MDGGAVLGEVVNGGAVLGGGGATVFQYLI